MTILLLIIFVSCQTRTTDKKADNQSSNIKDSETKINVIDTLNKYVGADTLFDFDNQRLYVGKANSTEFGFHSLSDTSFVVYQKLDTKWTITDTIFYSLNYVFKPTDLNGDNFEDIIITYAIAAAGGNGQNVCLLYNPKAKKFMHNEYYDLPNIKYDKQSNLVLSAWWGGVRHCQEKMSFKITGDSLTFNLGVVYCPDENNEGESEGVYFYEMKNGKRIIKNRIKGSPEKTWKIFEEAIWNSKDDF